MFRPPLLVSRRQLPYEATAKRVFRPFYRSPLLFPSAPRVTPQNEKRRDLQRGSLNVMLRYSRLPVPVRYSYFKTDDVSRSCDKEPAVKVSPLNREIERRMYARLRGTRNEEVITLASKEGDDRLLEKGEDSNWLSICSTKTYSRIREKRFVKKKSCASSDGEELRDKVTREMYASAR